MFDTLCNPKIATQDERLAYLQSQHTKQLLNQRSRYFNGYEIRDMVDNVSYVIPREEFYAELNTREHVPNKKEAKAARQAAAKRGR